MKHFDLETRARVRAKLIEYMTAHNIKFTILSDRIAEGDPKGVRIPVKTLYRFVNGTEGTNETAIAAALRFIASLTERDRIADLGESLRALFGGKLARDYSGSYRQADRPRLQFDIMKDAGFWRVIVLRPKEYGFARLEGVLVEAQSRALVILKDVVTNLPASFLFSKAGDELHGMGYITPYAQDWLSERRSYPERPFAEPVTLSKAHSNAL